MQFEFWYIILCSWGQYFKAIPHVPLILHVRNLDDRNETYNKLS